LLVILGFARNIFNVYNGLNFDLIGEFTTADDAIAQSFAFAPDNSFLVVGTENGRLFSYRINDNVIDPFPGIVQQNLGGKKIFSISVSPNLQIAAGGQS
jgi:hypothetical protein